MSEVEAITHRLVYRLLISGDSLKKMLTSEIVPIGIYYDNKLISPSIVFDARKTYDNTYRYTV